MVTPRQVLQDEDLTEADRQPEPLPATWRVPDALWELVVPVLEEREPPKGRCRHRVDPRRLLYGIWYRLCTGCQENHLPTEFGDDGSVHRTMQRWHEQGVFARPLAVVPGRDAEAGGGDW